MYLTKKPPFQSRFPQLYRLFPGNLMKQDYGERELGKKAVLVFTTYSLKRYHRQNLTLMGQYGSISCLLQM